jgi:hypothetical protein
MRAIVRILLACAASVLAGASAFAGSGLTVNINNDSTDTILVSVYDLNANGPQRVLSSEVINGNASVAVSIAADDQGHGHVSWRARTSDDDMRMCGSGDTGNLNDRDTVTVHADAACD